MLFPPWLHLLLLSITMVMGEEEKDRTTGQAKEEFILPQNTVEANTVDKGQTSLLSNILEAEPTSGSEAAPQPEDNKIWWTENIEEAIADLSQRFYHELSRTEPENFVFSPLSLHSALSLLLLGTSPETETSEEVQKMLGSIINPDFLKKAYKRLVEFYKKQPTFLYDNHVWVDERFNLNPTYVEEVGQYLGTNTTRLRFADKAAALNTINGWVSRATGGRVKTALDDIASDAQLYLANAIYLKEKWKTVFDKVDPRKNSNLFKLRGDATVKVNMMEATRRSVAYAKFSMPSDEFKPHEMFTIPYENEDFALQIILPNKEYGGNGLTMLEEQIDYVIKRDLSTAVTTTNTTNTLNVFSQPKDQTWNWRQLDLRMPQFKVASKFDAANVFKRMNLTRVFSGESELEKISTDNSSLRVESIAHAALIEVDREGTVAAAATVIEISFLSAADFDLTVVVDRPFIFTVRDMVNNIPILVGRVTNPATTV